MPAPLRRQRTATLARGLTTAAVLGATAAWWGPAWCAVLAPLIEAALAVITPSWDTVRVALASDGDQAVLTALFSTVHGFAYHGFAVPPGVWVRTQTLQGYAWQHPVILLTLWAAWPMPNPPARLRAGAVLLAAMVPVAVLDLSLALYGSLTDLMLAGTAPALAARSFPVQAMQVLEAGGRAALALAVGVGLLASLASASRPSRVSPGGTAGTRMPR